MFPPPVLALGVVPVLVQVLALDSFLTLVFSAMVVALAMASPGLVLSPPPALALGVAPFLVWSLALAFSPALGSLMILIL